ncbi:hypothetical protein K432DRAFT_430807 [Lepidopterella palustris CBS 459.81]|uniref:Mg2+ transporter protein n=1 Tax=Lepidopterella palustris CBS 459.81 TaxID=1314670 RepID=A0A8E2DWM8_9PEZI|nr:hypothetical protein K432DRAFT_430807 [Lepidopterella palustris CBS 459.81]
MADPADHNSYYQYVKILKNDQPHLAELMTFLEYKSKNKHIGDRITVYDFDNDFQWQKEEYTTTDTPVGVLKGFNQLSEDISDDPSENKRRLICVSHLTPSTAEFFGDRYDITADFFNRHLPGTEDLSGKLPSSSQWSLQVEFDELYEAKKSFKNIWPNLPIWDGSRIISNAVSKRLFLRPIWDYQPIDDDTFAESYDDMKRMSGHDSRWGSSKRPLNYFHFYLQQRVSVYLKDPGNTKTVIIFFYPRLDMYENDASEGNNDEKCAMYCCCSHKKVISGVHEGKLQFHAIPKPSPPPSEREHKFKPSVQNTEGLAFTFCQDFERHLDRHQKKREPALPFTHLFGASLFRLVAENWARTIERRNFDLSMLEFRPQLGTNETAIEEISSHRIAIARYMNDLRVSLNTAKLLSIDMEVLREKRLKNMKSPAEQPAQDSRSLETPPSPTTPTLKLAVHDILAATKMLRLQRTRTDELPLRYGRVGVIDEHLSRYNWKSIRDDFDKLDLEMQALHDRADKIMDNILALISIRSAKESMNQAWCLGYLTIVAFLLLPVSIVASIYGANLDEVHDHTVRRFSIDSVIVFLIVTGVAVGFAILWSSWGESAKRSVVQSKTVKNFRARLISWRGYVSAPVVRMARWVWNRFKRFCGRAQTADLERGEHVKNETVPKRTDSVHG